MNGQHQYEINLKKDDLSINLSSDDVYFISKQMDKWCRILMDDSYVPVSLPQRPQSEPVMAASVPAVPVQQPVQQELALPTPVPQPAPQPQAPPPPVEQPVAVQPAPVVAPAPPEVALPEAVPQVAASIPEPQVALQPSVQQVSLIPEGATLPEPAMPQPVSVAPQPVIEPALAAPPVPRPAALQPAQPPAAPVANDDFEAVMDSLMKDLEEDDEMAVAPAAMPMNTPVGVGAASAPQPGPVLPGMAPSVAAALPRPNPPVAAEVPGEPDLSFVASLADLCDCASASNSEDYLLLSAYYLSRFERQETFSLKRVNSVLVKSGLTPVNHSVLETVLSRGFLAMVPDLTGMAEVSEYMITADGRQAVLRLL